MKYYIDFEASEQEKKIISVGVVREDGQEFYSLVYTDDPMTFRIIQITGITQDEVNSAPSAADVFEKLYDWCAQDQERPEFICYGDGDLDFVYNNYLSSQSLKEGAMLSYLYLNMYDCSEEIRKHFYVNKTISLQKLGQYFDSSLGPQNHNALDDAKLLKMVYEHVISGVGDAVAFTEYVSHNRLPENITRIVRLAGQEVMNEFENMAQAVNWARQQPNDKGPSYLTNIEEKITRAALTNGKYLGSSWRIL